MTQIHSQQQQAPQAPQQPQPQIWAGPVTTRRRPPSIFSALALIAAVIALVIAVITMVRPQTPPQAAPAAPSAPAAPTYTADQIAAAKTQTCTAAERAIAGVRVATNRPDLTAPDDPLGWANTANARVALLAAAVHLPLQIEAATPQALKDVTARLSSSAGDAVSAGLTDGKYSGVPANAYSNAIDAFNAASTEVEQLCRQ